MKKELQHGKQNFGNPSGYSGPQTDPYRLGIQNTTDIVNESRIDRQLPGFSNNVNVSRMTFDQSFQVPSGGRQENQYDHTRNVLTSQSMPNNSFYQEKHKFRNPSSNYNMNTQNSFRNQNDIRNNQLRSSNYPNMGNSTHMNQPSTHMNQGYGKIAQNPSGYSNNSMGMNNIPDYSQNNLRNSSNNVMQRPNPSSQMGGMGQSNQFNPSPQTQRNPVSSSGNPPMEEIEKGQLQQFSKFLISKKEGIEAKLRTMPKVCRRVADKREKLQLNKELDEVSNELDYVQSILRGP